MDALLHLYEKRRPSHIIIEATGVAEPKAILETLSAANLEKVRGTDFLRLANLITVVDAGSLETHLGTTPSAARAKRHHLLAADRRRPIEELLIEQIECADLIVLNKTDQLETEADIERLASFLRSLNDRAETVACQFGEIDPQTVFARERFDIDETLKGARWRKLILSPKGPPQEEPKENEGQAPVFADFAPAPTEDNGRFNLTRETAQKNSHHEDYGLKSFIYESRRPFDEARFLKLLRSGLPGLVRAKGFYWSASAPKEVGLLSIAGKTLRADYIGHWWIDMVADGEVAPDEVPEIAHRCWVEPHGDRRQELVFIGIDLDEAYIRRELKACEVDEQTTKAHPASA
jgi:G3E family GTPase